MKKLRITVDNRVYDVTVEVLEDDEHVASNGHNGVTEVPHAGAPPRAKAAGNGGNAAEPGLLKAPISGTVQKVFVEAGHHVEAKAPVLLLDAMKMDTYIYAPRACTVREVFVHPGETVRVGQRLVQFDAEA